MTDIFLKILESPKEIEAVEELQRQIWSGSETDVVPAHMLLAAIHAGGLIIGAFLQNQTDIEPSGFDQNRTGSEPLSSSSTQLTMIGFVFGFPGLYLTADGPRLKHHSHMLGVLPDHRDKGAGFKVETSSMADGPEPRIGPDHMDLRPASQPKCLSEYHPSGSGLQYLFARILWRDARWAERRQSIRSVPGRLVG